ncbi:glycerophosphodiester phosphodiesterase [Halobacteriales archaeon SW_7_65_23]|nr:MAG: glycerophosphodiester phosphodiesterase [Halobacteriales archaeon SW_7_65_23]
MVGDGSNGVSRRNALKTTTLALGTVVAGGAAARDGGRTGSHEVHVTAHRGYRDLFPQNTVAAAVGASRLGADRLEIDLEATSDGEIVVFHDARLDDLTDESGAVAETPAETVRGAEVLDSGERIPTLSEVLDATDPTVTVNLEFKDPGPLDWEEFADRALRIAHQYPGAFYVSSFDPDALRAVRDVDPSVDVAPVFAGNPERHVALARDLGAAAVNPHYELVDEAFVETAHAEGREVNVWTIDTWQEATAPIEAGVDGLIADYPMVFQTGRFPDLDP